MENKNLVYSLAFGGAALIALSILKSRNSSSSSKCSCTNGCKCVGCENGCKCGDGCKCSNASTKSNKSCKCEGGCNCQGQCNCSTKKASSSTSSSTRNCKCSGDCKCTGECKCTTVSRTVPYTITNGNDTDVKHMTTAITKAKEGVNGGNGGPFGAVIVRNGEIIASEYNKVLETNDPTNHAEIAAIRTACKLLGRFSLDDCTIYSSCQPCPMCLSAIHWAKIPRLYFSSTAEDAASVGFDDQFLYDFLHGTVTDQKLDISQIQLPNHFEPFQMFQKPVADNKSRMY
eukprot:c21812_g1_i1.p1 GENE.c21812_g1_i1~~c21812_g1_i1.p1  ORF type:complete len:287 (+),score=98.81 c21812_g1_i1:24-884(+)